MYDKKCPQMAWSDICDDPRRTNDVSDPKKTPNGLMEKVISEGHMTTGTLIRL